MNQEFKKPWLDALRSGNYKQTKSVLYDGDGYCCLGVLCKVAGSNFYLNNREEVEEEGEEPHYMPTAIEYYDEPPGDVDTLTDEGERLFELDSGAVNTLVEMNDGNALANKLPKSFAEIADWIEENL